jgi:hypothetical protein
MHKLLIILLILKLEFTFGQDFSYPIINKEGRVISDFIPNSWSLLSSAKGDLNNDTYEDIAIALQFKDSITITNNKQGRSDTVITQPRLLAILFWDNSTKKYFLKEQSNTFILNYDNPNMDDPFDELKIKTGHLIINFRIWYSDGNWTTNDSYKFQFQDDNFALTEYDSYSSYRTSEEYKGCKINFITKKYNITTGTTINGKYKSDIKTNTFDLPVLKTIRTFPKPYTWNFNDKIII